MKMTKMRADASGRTKIRDLGGLVNLAAVWIRNSDHGLIVYRSGSGRYVSPSLAGFSAGVSIVFEVPELSIERPWIGGCFGSEDRV
jgi:hypothetical protein